MHIKNLIRELAGVIRPQDPYDAYKVEYRDLSALKRCPVHGEKLQELTASAASSRIGSMAEVTARLLHANELDDECRASCDRAG